MKILALIQGPYGQRIVDNIRDRCPRTWEVASLTVPAIAEPFVDDPGDYLPGELPPADLLLHLCESPQAAELITAVVDRTGARGVLASTDHGHWVPKGLQRQIQRELEPRGIAAAFPQPFCALTESAYGFGEARTEYTSEVISEFARHFGWPEFEVEFHADGRTITGLDIRRGAPCGSTHYTAGRSVGLTRDEAVPTSGLRCLHYPCLASMRFERNGEEIDTVMHNAGKVFNVAMEEALERSARTAALPEAV